MWQNMSSETPLMATDDIDMREFVIENDVDKDEERS